MFKQLLFSLGAILMWQLPVHAQQASLLHGEAGTTCIFEGRSKLVVQSPAQRLFEEALKNCNREQIQACLKERAGINQPIVGG